MKIKVTLGFSTVVCLMAWLDLQWTLWFLLCALIHELGHLITIGLLKVRIVQIEFCLKGAVIHTEVTDCRRELIIAAAGPVLSICFGFLLLRTQSVPALISLILGIANLMPVFPLDGGRVIYCIMVLLGVPLERVDRIMYRITFSVCLILMLLACCLTVYFQAGIWPIFAALVLLCKVGDWKNSCFSIQQRIK